MVCCALASRSGGNALLRCREPFLACLPGRPDVGRVVYTNWHPGPSNRAGRASLPSLRLAAVVLLLALSLVPKPRFCSVHASLRAAGFLMRSRQPAVAPPGYLHNFDVAYVPLYPWADYLAVLAHLRNVTPSQARVANLLHAVAVTGPTGRLSVFPAESATWLGVVAPEDEEMFAAALERAGDSVVVWDPSESRMRSRPRLLSTVLREYEPQARFGTIEIWRKK